MRNNAGAFTFIEIKVPYLLALHVSNSYLIFGINMVPQVSSRSKK